MFVPSNSQATQFAKIPDADVGPLQVVAYDIPECVICMQKLTDGLVALKCGHVFHGDCIEPIFSKRNSRMCPYCRCDLKTGDVFKLILSIPGKTLDYTNRLATLSGLSKEQIKASAEMLEKVAGLQESISSLRAQLEKTEREVSETKEKLGIQEHKSSVLKDKFIQLTTVNEHLQKDLKDTVYKMKQAEANVHQTMAEVIQKEEKITFYEAIMKEKSGICNFDFSEELKLIEQHITKKDIEGLSKKAKDFLCQCIKQEGRLETLEANNTELDSKYQQLKDRFRRLLSMTKEKPTDDEVALNRPQKVSVRPSGHSTVSQPVESPKNPSTSLQQLKPTSSDTHQVQQPPSAQLQIPILTQLKSSIFTRGHKPK